MITKSLTYLFYSILISIHIITFAHEDMNSNNFLKQQSLPIETVPLRLTLFSPYTDLDIFPGEKNSAVKNYFLFGILYSRTDYLSGLSISAISHVKKDVYGLQISFANIVNENLAGGQISFINYSSNVEGVQLGYVNISDDLYGTQTGIANIADNTNGIQFGITNITGDLNGAQAGIANIANNINGVQFGIANIADNTNGIQFGIYSQTYNELKGFQIGIVNYADNVKGGQLGLINIANDQTGASYGLMNFLLKTGQTKLSLWYDSYFPLNLALKAGSKYFYSKAQISAYPDASKFFDLAFGTGAQYPLNPIWLGAEFVLMETQKQNTNIKAIRAQYTFLLGTTVKHNYDLFMGVSCNSPEMMDKSDINDLIPNKNYFVSASLGIQYLITGVPNW